MSFDCRTEFIPLFCLPLRDCSHHAFVSTRLARAGGPDEFSWQQRRNVDHNRDGSRGAESGIHIVAEQIGPAEAGIGRVRQGPVAIVVWRLR